MPAGDPVYSDEVEFAEEAPIGRCVASGTQSLNDATATALTFTAEDFDSHNQHSTSVNPTRVTPNVAGIYEFRGAFVMSTLTSGLYVSCVWRLNGSTNLAPQITAQASGTAPVWTANVSIFVPMDGVSDYVEFIATYDAAAGSDVTNQSSQFSSVIEWRRVRALIT